MVFLLLSQLVRIYLMDFVVEILMALGADAPASPVYLVLLLKDPGAKEISFTLLPTELTTSAFHKAHPFLFSYHMPADMFCSRVNRRNA